MSDHPVSLTAEQIAEIQARLDARTPGEWLHDTACPFGFVAKCGDSSEASHYVVPRDLDWIPDGAKHDAEFIAHAPQDIADLLADRSARGEEVERLRAELAVADELVDEAFRAFVKIAATRHHDDVYGAHEDCFLAAGRMIATIQERRTASAGGGSRE